MTALVRRFRVVPFFRWYDLWVGAYWDRENRTLYVCPIPMFGLKIVMPWRQEVPRYFIFCAERDCDRFVSQEGERCPACRGEKA